MRELQDPDHDLQLKVGKSIDAAQTFDDFAVKNLSRIAAEQERNPPTSPSRVISLINPFAAFRAPTTERQVKELFIITAGTISKKAELLRHDSFDLGHDLEKIHETLGRIQGLATEEFGDPPRMHVLATLWDRFARPDDYEEHNSHSSLSMYITKFYKSAPKVTEATSSVLNRVEAKLREFSEDYATPGLTLKDEHLKTIIDKPRKYGQRLEEGKRKLQHTKEGERSQRMNNERAGTKTVSATLI